MLKNGAHRKRRVVFRYFAIAAESNRMSEDYFLPNKSIKSSFVVGIQVDRYYCDMVRNWDF